ncbi:40S ribosomal protein S21 [Pseudoloma neurophilia]|uniref:40S ribosomal protein S21 n=1 Tax=Pseudoloma neurophilia TaxID=146866 RepID=A0A0R0M0U8_9MICR|nr:40S ribosomal protein S21 [Pseudoloma neurophilia]
MKIGQQICDLSCKPISSVDKMNVQLTFVELDENGRATQNLKVLNVCGALRKEGKADGLVTEKLIG